MREVAFRREDQFIHGLAMAHVDAERPSTSATCTDSVRVRQSTPGLLSTADFVDGHDSENMKALGKYISFLITGFVAAIS